MVLFGGNNASHIGPFTVNSNLTFSNHFSGESFPYDDEMSIKQSRLAKPIQPAMGEIRRYVHSRAHTGASISSERCSSQQRKKKKTFTHVSVKDEKESLGCFNEERILWD